MTVIHLSLRMAFINPKKVGLNQICLNFNNWVLTKYCRIEILGTIFEFET